ncbi:autotransporter outer membrane beta-barrel domain-containing protein [Paremcibacter congregatus]|uniref:Autotransporter domain-containing protein n=1 Tax=Paremcibacter congregatus TaxID=2043170 RepID=A0A2G4YWB7_9PROT|nr:autotransporter outer membrane beta-barrel domain-containing protein [Paremcibacter congregatus]PHZ86553.1 hypothetical protein CRD36_01335 [Paremcibacter congregatus]QDE26358.1 autotransporter domain-containing protein [Paremcibacter congregatus]
MSCPYRIKLLSSTAVIGIVSTLLFSISAQAACLPESENPDAKIICDGAVSNSYISSGTNLNIKVTPGAVMTGSPSFTLSGNSKTLINEGLIQSSTKGIDSSYNLIVENSNLIRGADYGIHAGSGNLTIVNKVDAVIRGDTGISSANYPYDFNGTYDITNSGRLEGTGGLAIENPYHLTLNNQATGQVIGGIWFFNELNLNNAGLIDGGTNSALRKHYYFANNSTLKNSGTIKSAVNDDYTIYLSYTDISNSGVIEATGAHGSALYIGYGSVTNSGQIQTSGSGTALYLNGSSLVNEITGEIRATGTAINGQGATVTNFGSIVGDVDFSSSYYTEDTYRDMGGTITGNLNLGGGNDLFLYDYKNGTGISSVSGTVEPGDGVDSYGVSAEGEITIMPSLPLGFERFAVEARGQDTVISIGENTKNSGCEDFLHGVCLTVVTAPFPFYNPILVMGEGTVINNTTHVLDTDNYAVINLQPAQNEGDFVASFINNAYIRNRGENSDAIFGGLGNKIENDGGIRTLGRNSSGIRANGALSIINSGAIQTSGEISYGIVANYWNNNPETIPTVENSGIIETSGRWGIGLGLYGTANVINSGEIHTSGRDAHAAALSGSSYGEMEFENNGTLHASGVEASGLKYATNMTITNKGTISSEQSAAIASSSYYSDNIEIMNSATGQITGGNGIALQGYGSNNFKLDNAGNITGNVTFLDPDSNDYYCDYESVTNSGTISGSVIFGRCNDTFIHDGGTVSGVVDLGADHDRFILNIDSGAKFSDIAGGVVAGEGFDYFVYSSDLVTSVDIESHAGFEIIGVLAGDENAHITLNSTADYITDYLNISGKGTVTNTVNFKRNLVDNYEYVIPAIVRTQSNVTLINKADIELGTVGAQSKSAVYVDWGSNFTNDGTITALADNAIGINTVGRTSNTGTVTTGTGPAVQLYGVLENSGMLSSQGKVINIASNGSYESAIILNKASGVIKGHNGQAIGLDYYSSKSTAISNAGQIIGNISLGGGNDTYFANGGYLDGDLNLGNGDNTLFVNATSTGTSFLSGVVSAGYGSDAYGLVYRETSDAALVQQAGFERYAIGMIGEDTIVTLKETGQTVNAAISVAGNGTLINEMDIGSGYAFDLRSSGSALVNKAMIGGIKGTGQDISITNDGYITSNSSNFGIYLTNAAGAQVTNTGTLENIGYENTLVYLQGARQYDSNWEIILDGAEHTPSNNQITSFRNEGTITGGSVTIEYSKNIKFENSGLITSSNRAVRLSGNVIDAHNIGTIKTTNNGSTAVYLHQYYEVSDEDIVSFVNDGEILTTGNVSYAVYVNNSTSLNLTNRGEIKSTGGPTIHNGINHTGDAYQSYSSTSAVLYRNGLLTNEDGGTIEATKRGSIAVDMRSNTQDDTILENAGSIIGTDGVAYTDYYGTTHSIAGAIRGDSGKQIVRNSGLIKGSVDLGDGNDRFEMSEGGVMEGQVDGGLGNDHILLDYTSMVSVDGGKYLNFETLEKTGSGNFNLSGVLDIAEVTITAGTLSGTGTITGNVTNMGTISPGNSPGMLTIEGNLMMTEGSLLSIEAGDLVTVMGDASLTGSILQLAGDVNDAGGEFLAVTGTVEGQFSAIALPDNNTALFKHVSLVYGDQNATVVVEDQFAASDAAFKNSAEGKYVAALMAMDLSSETYAAFSKLSSLNSSELASALGQMTGESHAAAGQLGLISGQSMINSNRGRFGQHQGHKGMRLWVEGIGAFDRQDGTSNLSGHRENLYGILAGADFGLSDKAMVGFTLGYVDGHQTLNGLNASNDYKAYLLGLNGVYHMNRLRLGAAVSYGAGDVDSTRHIQTGVLDGTAYATYDLNYVTAQGELAYDLGFESVILEPQLGLSWTSVARKYAEETGLSGLNLAIEDDTQQTVTGYAAIRLAKNFNSESGAIITPELTVGLDYDVKQDGLLASSHFVGNSGASQNHYVATSGKSRLMIGAGLAADLTNGFTLYARYSGRYTGQRKLHQANIGFGINF